MAQVVAAHGASLTPDTGIPPRTAGAPPSDRRRLQLSAAAPDPAEDGQLQTLLSGGLPAATIPMDNPYCSCELTLHGALEQGESWLTSSIPMANPFCSCELTRVRPPTGPPPLSGGPARRLHLGHGGFPRLTPAAPVDNPYCSCKLTRQRIRAHTQRPPMGAEALVLAHSARSRGYPQGVVGVGHDSPAAAERAVARVYTGQPLDSADC